MNELRHQLEVLVRENPEVTSDAELCCKHLIAACPDQLALIDLLVLAIQVDVVEDLEKFPQTRPYHWIQSSLLERLDSDKHSRDVTRWAIDSWAIALGRKIEDQPKTANISRSTVDMTVDILFGMIAGVLVGHVATRLCTEMHSTSLALVMASCSAGFMGIFLGIVGGRSSATGCVKTAAMTGGIAGMFCGALFIGLLLIGKSLLAFTWEPLVFMAAGLGAFAGHRFGRPFGLLILCAILSYLAAVWLTADDSFISDARGYDERLLYPSLLLGMVGFPCGLWAAEWMSQKYKHRVVRDHAGVVSNLASSHNCDLIASSADPWNTFNRWLECVLRPQQYRNIASYCPHAICLRNVERVIRWFSGHESTVNDIAFSPTNKWMASASSDLSCRIWEVESGQQVQNLVGHWRSVNCVVFSCDGQHVVTGGDDHQLRLWDPTSGRQLAKLEGHTDVVRSVQCHPSDPNVVFSVSADNTIRRWDLATYDTVVAYGVPREEQLRCAVIGRDGRIVIGTDAAVIIVDSHGQVVSRCDVTAPVNELSLDSSGHQLLVAAGDVILLWDLQRDHKRMFPGGTIATKGVSWSGTDQLVVSGHEDGSVRIRSATLAMSVDVEAVDSTVKDTSRITLAASSSGETANQNEIAAAHKPLAKPIRVLGWCWMVAGMIVSWTAAGTFITLVSVGLPFEIVDHAVPFLQSIVRIAVVLSSCFGAVLGILIATTWFRHDYNCAVIKPRATLGALTGIPKGMCIGMTVILVALVARYMYLWNFDSVISMIIAYLFYLVTGGILGGMIGWTYGALVGVRQLRAATTNDVTGHLAIETQNLWLLRLHDVDELNTMNQRRSAWIFWSSVVPLACFVLLAIAMTVLPYTRDLGGTSDGRGTTIETAVPVNTIASDFGTREQWASETYLGHGFLITGQVVEMNEKWITLKGIGETKMVARCKFTPGSSEMARNNRFPSETGFAKVRRDQTVILFGSCDRVDSRGLVWFSECVFHIASFREET